MDISYDTYKQKAARKIYTLARYKKGMVFYDPDTMVKIVMQAYMDGYEACENMYKLKSKETKDDRDFHITNYISN